MHGVQHESPGAQRDDKPGLSGHVVAMLSLRLLSWPLTTTLEHGKGTMRQNTERQGGLCCIILGSKFEGGASKYVLAHVRSWWVSKMSAGNSIFIK